MRECPACKLCFSDSVQNCPIDGDATLHSIAGEPILEGKYQLEKRLGQGGMGVVYKARHNFLKTAHAIKVILPDLVGNDPNLVTRFRQEAIASAAVRHQNIVSVTDFGVVNGKMPFIVMEFVKGESLHDLLVRERRLLPENALEILSGICSGVSAAHRQDIVHRDLKPLNVMLCADKTLPEAVKILDFGLAKIKSGELLGSFIQAQTTGLMGSPYYMAPEQWSDDEPDVRADVYSLGVMLYQMLAGDVPFKGSSIPSIMRKHLSEMPPPLIKAGVDLAPEIETVVRHALEKEPEKRTPSVEQLVAELRHAIGVTSASLNSSSDQNSQLKERAKPADSAPQISSRQEATIDNSVRSTVLQVLTVPPQAKVYLDNKLLGTSEANGWLIAKGAARGKHRLKVVADGFFDAESEINLENETFQTVVQLRSLLATNVVPANLEAAKTVLQPNNLPTTDSLVNFNAPNDDAGVALSADAKAPLEVQNVGIRSYPEQEFEKTNVASQTAPKQAKPAPQLVSNVQVVQAEKSSSRLIPILGVCALGLLIILGAGLVTLRLLTGGSREENRSQEAQTQSSPVKVDQNASQTSALTAPGKPEMSKIEGGTFIMGRKDGPGGEQPIHEVNVSSFWMDKTEVTNAEYEQFVSETNHPAPEGWVNNKFLNGQEQLPVVKVSLDDARAFAKWRSNRYQTTYRLPIEAEWEYAARNGKNNNLYPWGNVWENGHAVVNQSSVLPVGSLGEGANDWGVKDLIGNVYEWTETPFQWYPGSNFKLSDEEKGLFIIRGACFANKTEGKDDKGNEHKVKITSTARQGVKPTLKSGQLGFRLVSSNP